VASDQEVSVLCPRGPKGLRPSAIDLFCGAGGLSLGLEAAGFDVTLGVDFDRHAIGSFATNHAGRALLADIRELSGADLLAEAEVSDLDLLAGGPSCQGFSTHGKRFADDPRNFLFREFLRLVRETRPATVLIENVRGMLLAKRGRFRDEIYQSFRDLGYTTRGYVVHAADYGVPQRRHRVVFMASRLSDEPIKSPKPTFVPSGSLAAEIGSLPAYRTVAEAISDLPHEGVASHDDPVHYASRPSGPYQKALRGRAQKMVWNHVTKVPSELAMSLITRIPEGQGLRFIPPEDLPERFRRMRRISNGQLRRDCTTLYHRLSADSPAYTITCYFSNVSAGAFTHPLVHRAISPREAARLQSFPDSFRFTGSYIPRQIGNAVPPLMAAAIGIMIREHLEKDGLVTDSQIDRRQDLVCV
jgi:DNA (cytosine-5)-methyltransferase 1